MEAKNAQRFGEQICLCLQFERWNLTSSGEPVRNSYSTKSTEQNPSWQASSFSVSQEIRTFYGTRRISVVFTPAHHLSLRWTRVIQTTSLHTISQTFTFTLSPIYVSVLKVSSFRHISSPKPCMYLSSPLHMLHAPLIATEIGSLNPKFEPRLLPYTIVRIVQRKTHKPCN